VQKISGGQRDDERHDPILPREGVRGTGRISLSPGKGAAPPYLALFRRDNFCLNIMSAATIAYVVVYRVCHKKAPNFL
jgi:hypothetical protein